MFEAQWPWAAGAGTQRGAPPPPACLSHPDPGWGLGQSERGPRGKSPSPDLPSSGVLISSTELPSASLLGLAVKSISGPPDIDRVAHPFSQLSGRQGRTQQTFVSHGPGGWESKVKGLADLVSGKGLLPVLLCPHMVDRELWPLLLDIRTLIAIMGPTLLTSSNPNHLPQAIPPKSITLKVGASTYRFGESSGDTNIQCQFSI